MAKQRVVNTRFWDDGFVLDLSWKAKLLFLYLLTNPQTELCGAYEISVRRIAFDTGLKKAEIDACLERFEAARKIVYRDNWVFIRNFAKHQMVNPKIARGIARSLATCPLWIQELAKESLGDAMVYDVPERVQVRSTARKRILERDGHKCSCCGVTDDLTIDHIVPVAAGGGNEDSNLRTLCRVCNGQRNAELRWSPNGEIVWMGEDNNNAHPRTPITPTPELLPEPEPEPEPEPSGETASPPDPPKLDHRRIHPAIVGIQTVTGKFPPKELWDELIEFMGSQIDEVALKRCWVKWRARGFKPTNFAWALEWYRDGIPEVNQNHGTNRTNSNSGNGSGRATSTDRLEETQRIIAEYPTEAELRSIG